MKKAKCVFNTNVAGANTASKCRKEPTKASAHVGTLKAGATPGNTFNVDIEVGSKGFDGTDGYGKILDDLFDGSKALKGTYVYLHKNFVSVTIEDSGGTTTQVNTAPPIDTNVPTPVLSAPDTTRAFTGFDSSYKDMLKNRRNFKGFAKNTRVFGCPHQFLPSTDMRVVEKLDIGREYYENILLEAPLVYFTPGLPKYMASIDKTDQDRIENYVKDMTQAKNISNEVLNKVFGIKGKYFEFYPMYNEYMRYVNMLCRACAVFLGIGDKIVPFSKNTMYKEYDWSRYVNVFTDETTGTNITENKREKGSFIFDREVDDYKELVKNELMGDFSTVKFYAEPSLNVSNSMTNNTREPWVKQYFEPLQSVGKDILFLSGTNRRGNLIDKVQDIPIIGGALRAALGGAAEGLQGIVQSLDNGDTTVGKMVSMAGDVLAGSNVVFPEIYNDSDYSQDYNISVTLATPYGDVESRYLNIVVPTMFLMAMSYPRQLDHHNYESPFMVKVFIPGMGSGEMCMITSLSIDSVNESRSIYGTACEVKVNIGVKDLYNELMITKTSTPARFLSNTGLIEHLMVNCGVDLVMPNLELKLETLISTLKGTVLDIPQNIERELISDFRGLVKNLSAGFLDFVTKGGW